MRVPVWSSMQTGELYTVLYAGHTSVRIEFSLRGRRWALNAARESEHVVRSFPFFNECYKECSEFRNTFFEIFYSHLLCRCSLLQPHCPLHRNPQLICYRWKRHDLYPTCYFAILSVEYPSIPATFLTFSIGSLPPHFLFSV